MTVTAEFGFARRIRERKAQEKRQSRKIFLGGAITIVGYCTLAVTGIARYNQSEDQAFGDALLTTLHDFGSVLSVFGKMFKEEWLGLVIMMTIVTGICFLLFSLMELHSKKERRALIPIYRRLAEIQLALEQEGLHLGDGGSSSPLTAIAYVLALNQEFCGRYARLLDNLADGVISKRADRYLGDLSADERAALRRLLDTVGNALEEVEQTRKTEMNLQLGKSQPRLAH